MNVIKVYGSGCPNCIRLADVSKEAVEEMDLECKIEKVTDMQAIVERGIMQTPGLEINGKIVSTGKIPTKATLIHWLKDNTGV